MSGSRARYYRGLPCCEGRAPEWGPIYEGGTGGIGGPLSEDEKRAISAVENYGGTLRVGHPPQLMPMEHTNLVDWNRPIFMAAADSWVAPFDRSLPRLASFADLPSLPDPDAGPGNGLPHHQQTLDYQARERIKQLPMTDFRIRYHEATGQHRVEILWCHGCGPDLWEQFCIDLGRTYTEMVPVIRGIAMVCSYVPVFGSAVSFVIQTTVSLTEGRTFDAAFLDGVGGALPGQPASGMAFTAARALINGDPLDKLAFDTVMSALHVEAQLRDVIRSTIAIAVDVAQGKPIATVALDEIRKQLPETGKAAMDLARRACNGENVGALLSHEALAAARAATEAGEAAVGSYIAQAGFQGALESLPLPLQDAVKAGVVVGVIEAREPFVGTFGSIPEKNVVVNEGHLERGRRLIAAGAKYQGRLVAEILAGDVFAIAIMQPDALTGTVVQRTIEYRAAGPWAAHQRPLTDAWRRGFTIALAVCEGSSQAGPGQTAVYQAMAEAGGRDGFDAGQAVAWWITKHDLARTATTTAVKAASAHGVLVAKKHE